jgi:hypothetical protein
MDTVDGAGTIATSLRRGQLVTVKLGARLAEGSKEKVGTGGE